MMFVLAMVQSLQDSTLLWKQKASGIAPHSPWTSGRVESFLFPPFSVERVDQFQEGPKLHTPNKREGHHADMTHQSLARELCTCCASDPLGWVTSAAVIAVVAGTVEAVVDIAVEAVEEEVVEEAAGGPGTRTSAAVAGVAAGEAAMEATAMEAARAPGAAWAVWRTEGK